MQFRRAQNLFAFAALPQLRLCHATPRAFASTTPAFFNKTDYEEIMSATRMLNASLPRGIFKGNLPYSFSAEVDLIQQNASPSILEGQAARSQQISSTTTTSHPRVEVKLSPDSVTLRAHLEGVKKESVTIRISHRRRMIVISGQRLARGGHREAMSRFRKGGGREFSRELEVPEGADMTNMKTVHGDGYMDLVLPIRSVDAHKYRTE